LSFPKTGSWIKGARKSEQRHKNHASDSTERILHIYEFSDDKIQLGVL
jgi:hypothetical protein